MTTLTFGSLFAGIGGFDLGFERAGMVCKWQVEIDDFCRSVLTKHWPEVPKYKDVRDVGKHNLETVDVVIGGFPCQPHSVAGKREGAADDRNLWPEFKRIIDELRPRWVVAENVPGIIHTYLDTVLSDLEGAGYSTGALNIPACGLDARHRRERIFIVGSNAAGDGRNGRRGAHEYERQYNTVERREQPFGNGSNGSVAHANGAGLALGESKPGDNGTQRQAVERGSLRGRDGHHVAYPEGESIGARLRTNGEREKRRRRFADGRSTLGVWTPEPRVRRVAHGIPDRVDRLRALGNAIVPQVAEFVGRQIVAVEGVL